MLSRIAARSLGLFASFSSSSSASFIKSVVLRSTSPDGRLGTVAGAGATGTDFEEDAAGADAAAAVADDFVLDGALDDAIAGEFEAAAAAAADIAGIAFVASLDAVVGFACGAFRVSLDIVISTAFDDAGVGDVGASLGACADAVVADFVKSVGLAGDIGTDNGTDVVCMAGWAASLVCPGESGVVGIAFGANASLDSDEAPAAVLITTWVDAMGADLDSFLFGAAVIN